MPYFDQIPVNIGAIDLQDEITEQAVSAIQAIAPMMGVTTVEAWKPQSVEAPHRAYRSAELPAVWVYAQSDGRHEDVPIGYQGRVYRLVIGVCNENASLGVGRTTHEKIRENVFLLFGSASMQGTSTFLNESGYQVWFPDDAAGDVQPYGENAYMMASINTVTCRVTVPDYSVFVS